MKKVWKIHGCEKFFYFSRSETSCRLNPDFTVDTCCGLKNLTATLVSRFWSSPYCAYASASKSFQLRVLLWFFNPRDDPYCKIQVKTSPGHKTTELLPGFHIVYVHNLCFTYFIFYNLELLTVPTTCRDNFLLTYNI